jgi:hypothetical protein
MCWVKKSKDANVYVRTMTEKMYLKFEKYRGECNLPKAVCAVLDQRFKLKLVQFCFLEIYEEPKATRNVEKVRSVLNELYGEYVDAHNLTAAPNRGHQSNSNSTLSSIDGSSSGVQRSTKSGMAMFNSFVRSVDTFSTCEVESENIFGRRCLYM